MPDRSVLRGSTGLRDDFDGKIVSTQFKFDSSFNDGKTCINLITVEVTSDEGKGEEEELKLSTGGTSWEPGDRKGETAQRTNGKDPGKGFNNQAPYQIFLDRALDAGFEDIAVARVDEGVMPWHTALWAGEPEFHFVREEYKGFNWKEGEPLSTRLVPSEFKGLAGEEKKAAKKAPAKAAAKEEAADEAADDSAAEGPALPGKIKVKLKKIAQETDDHDAFMERAYDELDDADDYSGIIDDPDAFYNEHHEG